MVTPSKPPPLYEQLLPLPTPCLKMFWKDPSMAPHPHHPTSSTFHCYPLPIHHPFPPKSFDHTQSCPEGGDFDGKISGPGVSPGVMVTGQIDTCIKFLERCKAPGPDNIHNEVLRLGTTTSLFHLLAWLLPPPYK